MAKKAGRPPGAQNKVGKDEKEFIKGLLGDTQEEFRKVFLQMAQTCNKENPDILDKKAIGAFMGIRMELSKMVVPKPVEIDANMNESQFEALMGLANKWNDEKD